ncbi:LOW QUALITY PROTEIN: frizzled-4-like [Lethenteron reissneri]|uniref:LOW QUALITY PROTEIN: frizzled-4-like n=1 Tax=Lethenteron reissneri TaxID=7753 RepID=UPI002AB67919|nr:LOW QUALITY PROTEIN: frizzled-4-like [Lethenteron reissneri]
MKRRRSPLRMSLAAAHLAWFATALPLPLLLLLLPLLLPPVRVACQDPAGAGVGAGRPPGRYDAAALGGLGVARAEDDALELSSGVGVRRCEPIRAALCQGLGYNATRVPNPLGHESQADAELQLQTFTPLVQYGCSAQLQFFLCAVHFPLCAEAVPEPIGPCAGMCRAVRRRCEPVLVDFQYAWPPALACDRFPTHNEPEHMCMEGPAEEEDVEGGEQRGDGAGKDGTAGAKGNGAGRSPGGLDSDSSCHSAGGLLHPDRFVFVQRLGACVPRCAPATPGPRAAFLEAWMGAWAAAALLASVAVAATFLMEPARFPYPERPVGFFAASHAVHAAAYVARLALGHERVACDAAGSDLFITQDGLSNSACAGLFLAIFYSSMTGAAWWTITGLSWFLSAGLKWGPEAVAQRAALFHAAAWALPALQAAGVLAARAVRADALTGTCRVRTDSLGVLAGLVLAPLALYLIAGAVFMGASIVSLTRIRAELRRDGRKQEKHERLTGKLSAFAVLSGALQAAWLACLARDLLLPPGDLHFGGAEGEEEDEEEREEVVAAVALACLRIAASLLPAVVSVLWVSSGKTARAWGRCLAAAAAIPQGRGGRGLAARDGWVKPGAGETAV